MNTKNKIQKLPDSEHDIMLVLWSYDRPVRIIEIYNDLKSIRPCTKSAIHALVDHLLNKGFVRIEYSEDRQSHKCITPLVSEKEYRASATDTFLQKLCGGRWQTLIAALVDSDAISDKDLSEIEALLQKKGGKK